MNRLLALCLLLAASACATPKTLYDWGNYSRISLLEARGSMKGQEYADALRKIIANAEATNKVPPGVYAEYGFALLELGDRAGAVEWFAKERAKWPESVVFMDRLIAVASAAPTSPVAPAGSTPLSLPPTDAMPSKPATPPVLAEPSGNR